MQVKRLARWVLVALLVAQVSAAGEGSSATLVAAVKNGDAAAVRLILKQANAANVAEADGTTALHVATDLDDLATARLLVRAGANVRAANRYGITPLYSATVNGSA